MIGRFGARFSGGSMVKVGKLIFNNRNEIKAEVIVAAFANCETKDKYVVWGWLLGA